MDDSTGTAIDDLETANNNGTYFGSPTKSQAGAIAGNNAVLFDGVDDYGSIARQVSADFSVEFWFKSTQGLGTTGGWQSYAGLVDNNVTGSNNDWGISLSADGHVMAGIGGGTGGGADATISSLAGGWDDNNWHHVVLTRTQSSGAYALYIDGGTPVTGTNNTALLNAVANINFGRIASGANYYQGNLDEIAIYNSVLSGATIAAHYAAR